MCDSYSYIYIHIYNYKNIFIPPALNIELNTTYIQQIKLTGVRNFENNRK